MFIYLITNKLNGKYYVGQTRRTLEARWRSHVKDSKKLTGIYFYKALRKYGKEAFKIEALCECRSIEELNKSEKFFIWLLGSTKTSLGYNGTLGGEGTVPTKETRHKMSLAKKGKRQTPEAIEARVSPMRGRKRPPFSKEWLENMSKSSKENGITKDNRQKMTEGSRKVYKDFCNKGHKRTSENTVYVKNGRGNIVRNCMDCRRAGRVRRKLFHEVKSTY